MSDKLTRQQMLFCHEYIKDFHGTNAAIRAEYSPRCAEGTASRLLTIPKIAAFVSTLQKKRMNAVSIDADYVLKRLVEIDALDVADILDDEGNPLPISVWPKSWRTSISGIDIQRMTRAGGDSEALSSAVMKIKWPDKAKNLDQIGRHIKVGAWRDPESDASEDIVEAFNKLAQRLPE
jgi:phage terminase small subunit